MRGEGIVESRRRDATAAWAAGTPWLVTMTAGMRRQRFFLRLLAQRVHLEPGAGRKHQQFERAGIEQTQPHRFRCRRRPARLLCLSKSTEESGLLRWLAFQIPRRKRESKSATGALATMRDRRSRGHARTTAGAFSSRAKSFTASLLAKPRACHPVAWLPLTTKSATRAA